MVEVIQSDRELLASLIESLGQEADEFEVEEIRLGLADGVRELQLIAQHRANSTAQLEAENAALREWVAKLYCAAGCDCCRDTDGWYEAAGKLGEMLNIPKYDDGSGYDFYAVRDQALTQTTTEKK